MEVIFKTAFKNHIDGALARDGVIITVGQRLSSESLLFIVQETKKYYTTYRANFERMFAVTDEIMNAVALRYLADYLRDKGFDIESSNAKQRSADDVSPTVLDFVTALLARGNPSGDDAADELGVDDEAANIALDINLSASASPSTSTKSKSNTGMSGKFKRFLKDKKSVDDRQRADDKSADKSADKRRTVYDPEPTDGRAADISQRLDV